MGIFKFIESIFDAVSGNESNTSRSSFSGKNKSAISDGLRKGSKECAKKMANWRWKKGK